MVFNVHTRRYQISFAFWFLPNRSKFWQTPPMGERDGLIPARNFYLKKNHLNFFPHQNTYLWIMPVLDLANLVFMAQTYSKFVKGAFHHLFAQEISPQHKHEHQRKVHNT